jgi:hypothetical protein
MQSSRPTRVSGSVESLVRTLAETCREGRVVPSWSPDGPPHCQREAGDLLEVAGGRGPRDAGRRRLSSTAAYCRRCRQRLPSPGAVARRM